MRGFVLGILVWGLAVGCKDKGVPKEFIQPERMGNILWDMALAEEFVNGFVMRDSSKVREVEIQKEYQKIFGHYSISRQEFEKSYRYYIENPVIFRTVMDTVNQRAQRLRERNYTRPSRIVPLKK